MGDEWGSRQRFTEGMVLSPCTSKRDFKNVKSMICTAEQRLHTAYRSAQMGWAMAARLCCTEACIGAKNGCG